MAEEEELGEDADGFEDLGEDPEPLRKVSRRTWTLSMSEYLRA